MRTHRILNIGAMLAGLLLVIATIPLIASCQSSQSTGNVSSGEKSIVVTYSILGSVVKDLVGDNATVTVIIPSGVSPCEGYDPSAKDVETLSKADLVVENGLGLEVGMQNTLQQVKDSGVKFFTASDYIIVRHVGPGEGIPSGDPDQATGAADPHLWTDPVAMKEIVAALAVTLKSDLGIDVNASALDLEARLDALNQQISDLVNSLPPDNRKLVTGHESMGYFAQRYGFKLVGAIIPSLNSEAEVSAADLETLKNEIEQNHVKAIFTELGTSPAVAKAIGDETGVKVVELTTHILPADGSYFTFEHNLAQTIVDALK